MEYPTKILSQHLRSLLQRAESRVIELPRKEGSPGTSQPKQFHDAADHAFCCVLTSIPPIILTKRQPVGKNLKRPLEIQQPERMRGGKRWTPDDEARLLTLALEGKTPLAIAATLQRSYSSVQHRLKELGRSTNGATLNPEIGTRPFAERGQQHFSRVDLTCGAISPPGRLVVQGLWDKLKNDTAIAKRREPSTLRPEIQCIIGAIVREAINSCDSDKAHHWARVAISRVRAADVGVDSGVLRNLLGALERQGLLETFVGYPGILELGSGAKHGRTTLFRAVSRLVEFCQEYGITRDNSSTHFPSLAY